MPLAPTQRTNFVAANGIRHFGREAGHLFSPLPFEPHLHSLG